MDNRDNEYPAVLHVEMREHGKFSAPMSAVQSFESIAKEALARSLAQEYATHRDGAKLFATIKYWNRYPKTVLAIIAASLFATDAVRVNYVPAKLQTFEFKFQGYRSRDHAEALKDALLREYPASNAKLYKTTAADTFYIRASLAHQEQADAWAITCNGNWHSFKSYGAVPTPANA